MSSIGVGIIGAGVMGAEHAHILASEVAGARVVAVADADPGRARMAAYSAKTMTDGEALIDEPDVDAVLIASPDATHHRLVLAAIAAGKPVLCEKPLATSTAECLEIVEAEIRSGRSLVQTGFMRRFDPTYREMKTAIDGRSLGGVRVLHCQHRNAAAPSWFTGAMAITNSLVHELDICRWLLSTEYEAVTVFPFSPEEGSGGDPALVVLETQAGPLVSVEIFMNAAYGYHVHAEAVCTSGTIAMGHPALTSTRGSGKEERQYPQNWIPRFRDAYRIQNQAWIDGIRDGALHIDGSTAWDGLVATCLADQIVEAMASRQRTRFVLPAKPRGNTLS